MEKERIETLANILGDEEIRQLKLVFEQGKLIRRGEEKIVTCPLCGKKRHIAKSGYNGHFRSVCESENCLRIMQ